MMQDTVLRSWCRAALQAFNDMPDLVTALDRQLRLGPGSSWEALFGNAAPAHEVLATRPGLATQQQLQVSPASSGRRAQAASIWACVCLLSGFQMGVKRWPQLMRLPAVQHLHLKGCTRV